MQKLFGMLNDLEKKVELTFPLSLQCRFQSANCTSPNEYSKKRKVKNIKTAINSCI